MKISSRLARWPGGWRIMSIACVFALGAMASATLRADIRVFEWDVSGPVSKVVMYWSADDATWTECGRGAADSGEFLCVGHPTSGKFDLKTCAVRTDGVEICWERAGQWYDMDAQPIEFKSFKTQRVD